jgi:hypothetical protein
MAAPVAWDGYDPITLEGALQSAVVLRETGRTPDDVFVGCPSDASLEDADIQIPISDVPIHVEGRAIPIACCSVGRFSEDAVPTLRYIRKRPRAENYRTKIVNIAMAEYKASNIPVATVTCTSITFWVLGDAERLRDLLRDCGHLGAHRSGGLGSVLGWEVTVDATSAHWPAWQDERGRLMRSVPDSLCEYAIGFERRAANLRAPYWHKRTQALCKVPIVEVAA